MKTPYGHSIGENLSGFPRRMQEASEGVTMTQIMIQGASQLLASLETIYEMIAKSDPSPAGNNKIFLSAKVKQINENIKRIKYRNICLANGNSGVRAEIKGDLLRFVRGGDAIRFSRNDFYPVIVDEFPQRAWVKSQPMTKAQIAKEKGLLIKIKEKYHNIDLEKESTSEQIMRSLMNYFAKSFLDYSVGLDEKNRLVIYSNQFGTQHNFEVLSEKTEMFIDGSKNFKVSTTGKDINGRIGDIPTFGIGSYIIASPSDNPSDGLILAFTGYPREDCAKVGEVRVINSNWYYENQSGENVFLSFPSLDFQDLSIGVANRSGFNNLSEINVETPQQKIDSLLFCRWAIEDVRFLIERFKQKNYEFLELSKLDTKLRLKGIGMTDQEIRQTKVDSQKALRFLQSRKENNQSFTAIS